MPSQAAMVNKKGYATAAIGKWGLGHFGTTGEPNKQGFDHHEKRTCAFEAQAPIVNSPEAR